MHDLWPDQVTRQPVACRTRRGMVSEVYVMKKLNYPAYVNIVLKPLTKEHQQELRGSFYSAKGKIARYEDYVAYCKKNNFEPDAPPPGYWDSKEQPWHKPVGYGMILLGYLAYFMGMVASSGVRGARKRY